MEVCFLIKSNLPILMAKCRIRTVAELSEKTGISRTTLRTIYYGKGKGVQYQTLLVLCRFFKVGIGEILECELENKSA
ncbi:DNA binding/transcriptional regulator [Brevibacillus phage Jimmer1]|uniref:DNA binding/transcriptional regulator n=4 Tax=Jimmervirus TaxID=1984788 RepID=S5MTM9_9CAUD|nr:transcriptional regulator [Brevibacillus phage Osiris]YP_009226328.1 transcriptional regulator [Brevibacillus phage Jimmer1]YP_009606445.1 transcriptional regulator [Brevibacillus phage Jimmer2]ALA48030.1 putative DNA binding/transcriptional regulator [Brevibacillus phage Powder]AGR47162.1 DNA binding/transcriptional regulator [Brevibacillus phage Jimmer2]AGR47263.1 DNA binding/transcriptional regulator [Brevibacillus phage Jimmer1]ALA07361.1 putative DNA binding/transcriptional regulator 